ncbi:MAG TPA: type II toxin-antitoxin system VapC family toxin [Rhizomicrobium sp.]|jgi:tRNA(fMet)-specific endonuclease VapC|nr:type II toxin-antitoxin system VapC family toxin [Rhizomicrobium sp.]
MSGRRGLDDIAVSVVTKAELLYGVDISPRPKMDEAAVAAFLAHVAVLDFPDAAARHYAGIRGHLKRKGYFAANTLSRASMIGANDLFIAAHAALASRSSPTIRASSVAFRN